MVEATPLNPLGIDVLVLSGWIIVCLSLSLRFFRWE
jgi:ABC-2 type transport system permease protein